MVPNMVTLDTGRKLNVLYNQKQTLADVSMFFKISALKNFAIFTVKLVCWGLFLK